MIIDLLKISFFVLFMAQTYFPSIVALEVSG